MQHSIPKRVSAIPQVSMQKRNILVDAIQKSVINVNRYVFSARSPIQTILILARLRIKHVLFYVAYIQSRNGIDHILVCGKHTVKGFFSITAYLRLHKRAVKSVRKLNFFAVGSDKLVEFDVEIVKHSKSLLEQSAE